MNCFVFSNSHVSALLEALGKQAEEAEPHFRAVGQTGEAEEGPAEVEQGRTEAEQESAESEEERVEAEQGRAEVEEDDRS